MTNNYFNMISKVLREVENVRNKYNLFILDNNNQRSVNELLGLCRQTYGVIELIEFDHRDDSVINGLYIKYADNKYAIYYSSNLNNCWKRFVLCKELFHVILDEEDICNPNIKEHVEAVLFTNFNEQPIAAQYENLCELAALEFLFPFKERKNIKQNQLININYNKIADKYKIPQVYVEIALSDKTMQSLERITANETPILENHNGNLLEVTRRQPIDPVPPKPTK